MNEELHYASIAEIARLLRRKKLSPVELVQATLARVEQINPRLNAFLAVTAELALRAAQLAEREIVRGRFRGPLQGIPITLKDNIATARVPTTAGSRILADFLPPADAEVAERLARAGALLIGKTNLHEFAYGVTAENPHYGATRNPWNLERIAGGSSGGSAATVAAGLGFASVGTDTGGSIRIPAALCGVVGLKPNYGRVGCRGIVPLARSLDHAGPLARSVADAAIVLEAISSPHLPGSRFSAFARVKGKKPLRTIRLGWPRDYFFDRVDAEILRALKAAAKSLEELGARLEEVPLPWLREAEVPSTQIALAEALEYHESQGYFPARAAEYGEDVRKRLEMGGAVRAVDYLRAQEAREKVRAAFRAAFENVDAILAPTAPIAAPRLGQKMAKIAGEEESVRSALVRLNRPANFTGFPCLSVPCGFTSDGLPMGMALLGREWGEAQLLRIAFAYEQITEWHCRHPFP